MKKMMKSFINKTKRYCGLLLAFVLICSTVLAGFVGGKDAVAGDTATAEESILQTAGTTSVSAARNADTRLGAVSSVDAKFTFKLTHPGDTITGGMKINLFSPKSEHIWMGGYLLCISARTADTVDFALRNSVGEALLSYPGTLNVTAGDTMEISAWIAEDVLHITVNGTEIITFTNGSNVEGVTYHIETGVYMGVYNEWSAVAKFTNVSTSTESSGDFEELDDTLGTNSVKAAVNKSTELGKLSSTSKGFTFKINHPGAENNGKNIKIGLFNTSKNNCWANGYILNVSGRTDSSVDFALRKGNGETLISYPGTLEVTGDTLTIAAWIEGETFHLTLNGEEIMIFTNGTVLDGVAHSVEAGVYLSAYNEWATEAVFSIVTENEEEEDAFASLPDVSSDVSFEDLTTTLGQNSMIAGKQMAMNLGQLSGKEAGFAFKITRPTPASGGSIKIGLYNTGTTNPWANGYILIISSRDTDGIIDFAVRKGSDETLIAYPGEFSGFTGDYLTVNTWVANGTFFVGVNGKVIASWTNDGSVQEGTYLSVYNEWQTTTKIMALAESEEGKEEDKGFDELPNIPSNITFEDLGITAGLNSTVVSSKSAANLGQLSSTNVGFKFKITCPTPQFNGSIKMGLYNTETTNPWTDGYILVISSRATKGIVDFAVRKGSDETLIAYPGEVDGLTDDELEIYTWIAEGTFYVGLNGKIITSWKNDGSVKVGTYLSAYSEFAVNPTIKTFTKVSDDPLAKYPDVPSNIKFEDLGTTKWKNTVQAYKSNVTVLGQLSSKKVGFKFKLEVPKATAASECIKIGVYNTEEYNPWTDGYLIIVSTRPTQGTLDFAIRKGKDETLIAYPGEFPGFTGKDITISTWIKNKVFYLAVNDKVIASWTNDGSVKVGTYLAAYSEWSQTAVFKTIKKIDENASRVPDTSGDIDFMDIGQTARKNTIEVPTAQVATLGQLKSTKNGFKFKVTAADTSELSSLKIGIYNTQMNNPWTDGYLVIFSGTETKGMVSVCLRKGSDETLLALPDPLTDIKGDITVHAWLTDVDAANGAHTFHVKINGKEIITYTNTDGSVLVGPHLAAYNERKQYMAIKTFTIVDENAFPAPPDTSGDIVFQDLGKTMKLNEVNCVDGTSADLGKVSSVKNGFIFKMTTPAPSDGTSVVKIGLYNLEKKNPWTDGYILNISSREEAGTLDFALRKGKDEMLVAYPGTFKGFDEEYLTIKAWLTDTDAKGNAHTIHVSINGVEYLTYTNTDGSVQIGTYMSVYNDGMETLTFYTIEEVLEPSDMYLKRFGDPTDINGKCRVVLNDNEKSVNDEKTINGWMNNKLFLAGGVSIVAIIVVAVVILLLLKGKKRI